MTAESNDNGLDRRRFLSLGAAAGAGILAATRVEAAHAGERFAQDSPAKGSTPGTITAMPLPEKVFSTANAGISRKTHEEHYKLYQGYVNKVNEIRGKLAALGVPDATKANQTYSDIRELKVAYTFALGGVKNHELYFNTVGGKGGAPTGPVGDAIKAAFGSYDNWKADLKATGVAARGWT
jgi:Fe-Mn family superoxide dismutase